MKNNVLSSAFEFAKNTIWKSTHKDAAKMLIWMGALGFALSSLAQCYAIKTNDKIDKNKKNFMLAQEAADGAVNIGLFLAITNSVWKMSDKLLQWSGLAKIGKKIATTPINPNAKSHIKSGSRIFTTMVASVVACNIVTPLVRNVLAGKFRAMKDKKEQNSNLMLINMKKEQNLSPFKNFDMMTANSVNVGQKTPVFKGYSYNFNSNGLKI